MSNSIDYSPSTKPKLLQRFLRSGSSRDKIQSDFSFGGVDASISGSCNGSVNKNAPDQRQSKVIRRRGSGSGAGTNKSNENRASPSPLRGTGGVHDYHQNMSELDYLMKKNNLNSLTTSSSKSVKKLVSRPDLAPTPYESFKNGTPPTAPFQSKKKNKLPPSASQVPIVVPSSSSAVSALTRSNPGTPETVQESSDQGGFATPPRLNNSSSSSSIIAVSRTFSGVSLTSIEKTTKRVNSNKVYKHQYHPSDESDTQSTTSKSSLKRGLKKGREESPFVRKFTSGTSADRKKSLSATANRPPVPSIKAEGTTIKSLSFHPPRSLTITRDESDNGVNDTPSMSSPISSKSNHSNEVKNKRDEGKGMDKIEAARLGSIGTDHKEKKTKYKSKKNKAKAKEERNSPLTLEFPETATAREVIDAIAAKKASYAEKALTQPTVSNDSSTLYTTTPPTVVDDGNDVTPLTVALNLVGGLGAVVQSCYQRSCGEGHDDSIVYQESTSTGAFGQFFGRNGSLATMDTFEKEQLLDEIERYERMNSWDTLGTLNTSCTVDTGYTSVMTGATGISNASSQSNENSNLIHLGSLNKDSIMRQKQPETKTTTGAEKKKKRKKRKKKKKRKRTVGFEYPPISTMKEIPRITSEERKKLFFTEDELDEYEKDRRYNISDDVEVVAVEGSDSEEDDSDYSSSEEEQEEEGDDRYASNNGQKNSGSALRQGKFSNPHATSKASGIKDNTNSGAKNISNSSDRQGNGSESKGKKLKGVQIYLRQRSKA